MERKIILYKRLHRLFGVIAFLLALASVVTVPVMAWFSLSRTLGAYAPIAKPEALFIGAGHRDFDAVNHVFTGDYFENIRYLYFEGIDVGKGAYDAVKGSNYYDYVFCVFGKAIPYYKLQLAYTTNNQFDYEIFHAAEYTATEYGSLDDAGKSGCIEYVTHTETPETYYYKATGSALTGSFLNLKEENGEKLGLTVGDTAGAGMTNLHEATYGAYVNVQKYAEPLYWQSSSVTKEVGHAQKDFINYYILRVYMNGKTENDRETDVICIAAKSA